jgi:hypothetical protein
MVMQYHLSLGVGNSTQVAGGSQSRSSKGPEEECYSELDEDYDTSDRRATCDNDLSSGSGSIDGRSSEDGTDQEDEFEEDEELLAMEDMYGY